MHTNIRVGQQARARAADARVPLNDLLGPDATLCRDVDAGLASLDKVEPITVGDHAGLGRLGSLDSVAWRSTSRAGGVLEVVVGEANRRLDAISNAGVVVTIVERE